MPSLLAFIACCLSWLPSLNFFRRCTMSSVSGVEGARPLSPSQGSASSSCMEARSRGSRHSMRRRKVLAASAFCEEEERGEGCFLEGGTRGLCDSKRAEERTVALPPSPPFLLLALPPRKKPSPLLFSSLPSFSPEMWGQGSEVMSASPSRILSMISSSPARREWRDGR